MAIRRIWAESSDVGRPPVALDGRYRGERTSSNDRGQRESCTPLVLAKQWCSAPLGTNWLTFRPDTTIITGSFDLRRGPELCQRAAEDSVRVTFHDRTAEDADLY